GPRCSGVAGGVVRMLIHSGWPDQDATAPLLPLPAHAAELVPFEGGPPDGRRSGASLLLSTSGSHEQSPGRNGTTRPLAFSANARLRGVTIASSRTRSFATFAGKGADSGLNEA